MALLECVAKSWNDNDVQAPLNEPSHPVNKACARGVERLSQAPVFELGPGWPACERCLACPCVKCRAHGKYTATVASGMQSAGGASLPSSTALDALCGPAIDPAAHCPWSYHRSCSVLSVVLP